MHQASPPVRRSFVQVGVHGRRLAGLLAAGLVVGGGGCFYNDTGLSPPPEGFYYPTGLVVSPGRSALYVANSDFDLQYNGGTVDVVDLQGLRGSLIPLLHGIRCSSGNDAECTTAGLQPGTPLTAVCNAVPVSLGTGASGEPCQTANDCAGGDCLIGSDGIDGTCQDCVTHLDCPGPGFCQAVPGKPSVCMLALATNQILDPAACTPLAPPVKASGSIGAFASGAVLALDGCDPTSGKARLFVPVRGDPSITWFDVIDDTSVAGGQAPSFLLDCGQAPILGSRCDDAHRIGVDPYDNFRGLTIPVSPVGLDVSSDGTYLVSAHQISGSPAVGLSVNSWPAGCPSLGGVPAGVPSFQFYLTGSVAPGPSEVARVPEPKLIGATQTASTPVPYQYEQGFVVTYSGTAEVDIFRVDPDATSSPSRPFLTRAGQTPITINATGTDSRGVVIDPSARQACEAACAPGPSLTSCLVTCIDTRLQMYIANRTPPSLLIGQVNTQIVAGDVAAGAGSGVFDSLQIYGQVPLTVGPSKVVLGHALMPDGTLKSYVFAVAFDTRSVFMYDPVSQQVVQVVFTGRGPDPIAFDACCDGKIAGCTIPCNASETPHAFLYVGQFTDSYVGVVDLDTAHPETFGTMFASIGEPLPPLESQ